MPNVRDALADIIEQVEGLYNNDFPTVDQLAEGMAVLGATVQRWIPTDERLPKNWWHPGDATHAGEPIDFIVFVKGALIPCALRFDGLEFYDPSTGRICPVERWMPLPGLEMEV